MIERRTFLTGLFSALAAPAIVRASSLMPVRLIVIPHKFVVRTSLPLGSWRMVNQGIPYRKQEEDNLIAEMLAQCNDVFEEQARKEPFFDGLGPYAHV